MFNILKENKGDTIDENKYFLLSLVSVFKKLTNTQKIDANIEFLSTLKSLLFQNQKLPIIPISLGHSLNYGFHRLAQNKFSQQNLQRRLISIQDTIHLDLRLPTQFQVVAVMNHYAPDGF